MNDITESSILIEFLKSPSTISSYSQLATKWHIQQQTKEAAQLAKIIERLNSEGLIKEIELNPTNYFLPDGGEGKAKAIDYFLAKEDNEALSKIEQGAINYMIRSSHNGRSEVDVRNSLRVYLFNEHKLAVIPFELMNRMRDDITSYLYKNEFINYPKNSTYTFTFDTYKGGRLCRLGTIQEYWKESDNRHEMPIIEYLATTQKEREKQDLLNAELNERLKGLHSGIASPIETKNEFHTHIHSGAEVKQINQGENVNAKLGNKGESSESGKSAFGGMSPKAIKEGVTATIISAIIIGLFSIVAAKVGCNSEAQKINNSTNDSANKKPR